MTKMSHSFSWTVLHFESKLSQICNVKKDDKFTRLWRFLKRNVYYKNAKWLPVFISNILNFFIAVLFTSWLVYSPKLNFFKLKRGSLPNLFPQLWITPLEHTSRGFQELTDFRFEAFPIKCDVISENDKAVFQLNLF